VPPNPDLPKLRKKTEDRVKPADAVSATGLDALDEANDKWGALTEQMDGGNITVDLQIGESAVHILKKI
jgi:hypothetical protein